MADALEAQRVDPVPRVVPFAEATRAWLRVAIHSFGGPAGQISVLHRVVVEEKGWISERSFLHALSYCMLLPGPEAQQLATYMGWRLHGTLGGLVAGSLFIAPGFLSILGLSVAYAEYGETLIVSSLFYGLKAAVIAIVLHAVYRLRSRTLSSPSRIAVAAMAFAAMFLFGVRFPFVVLGSGLVGVVLFRAAGDEDSAMPGDETAARPDTTAMVRSALLWVTLWFVPIAVVAALVGREHVFVDEALFFSKAAVVTFGGAYAVLAYLAQQAVDVYQWLAPGEMLDGLGMAETTPGPLIQVVQFVGFMGAYRAPGALDPLLAGVVGSAVTTWATFVPCFLFIFVGAPYVEYLSSRKVLNAALAGITAAVVGVILNLAAWFSANTLFADLTVLESWPVRVIVPTWSSLDVGALAITAGASVAMFRFRVGMFSTLATAALIGITIGWLR